MSALSIRIDDNLRRGAEMTFRSMGLSMADGIRSYLNYVNVTKKLPFEPGTDPWHAHNTSSHIPNAQLRKTIEEADKGIGIKKFNNSKEMFEWLESDDDEDGE